jgi:hypothetical protein
LQKLRTAKKSKSSTMTRSPEVPMPQVDKVIKIPPGGPATPRVVPAGPNPFGGGIKGPAVNPFAPKGPAGGAKPPAAVKNPFK